MTRSSENCNKLASKLFKNANPPKTKQRAGHDSPGWTFPQVIAVATLGTISFYATHRIEWHKLSTDHIFLPQLHHSPAQITDMLNRQRRSIPNSTSAREGLEANSHGISNSHNPQMDLILQDIKETPLNKRDEHDGSHITAVEKARNFTRFLYPASEYVPLDKLDRIYITTGYQGLSFYKQGAEIPPGYTPELYFDGKPLLKSAFTFDNFEQWEQNYLSQDPTIQMDGGWDVHDKLDSVVYDPSLPCANHKQQEPELPWERALTFDIDPTTAPPRRRFGGGRGGGGGGRAKSPQLTDDDIKQLHKPAGKPIGCCNGRPYSAIKRCCCRRKSYNTETEFCCARDGCNEFEVYKLNNDSQKACESAGGIIVLQEKFDYKGVPMLGWAKQQVDEGKGPAQVQKEYEESISNMYNEKHGVETESASGDGDGSENSGVDVASLVIPEEVTEGPGLWKHMGDEKKRRRLNFWRKRNGLETDKGEKIELGPFKGVSYMKFDEDYDGKREQHYWNSQLKSWRKNKGKRKPSQQQVFKPQVIFNG